MIGIIKKLFKTNNNDRRNFKIDVMRKRNFMDNNGEEYFWALMEETEGNYILYKCGWEKTSELAWEKANKIYEGIK